MTSVSEYISLFHKLKQSRQDRQPNKVYKVALLATFTTKGFEETLTVMADQAGVSIEMYVADYNQYAQQIFDDHSELYEFKPDIVFLFIDIKALLGDEFFTAYTADNKTRRRLIKTTYKELTSLIATLSSQTKAKVVVHNFEVPAYSPLGLVENKQEFGFIESIQFLNHQLRETYKNNYQVFVLEYDDWCSFVGKQRTMDWKMYYVGDLKVSFELIPQLCEVYVGYLKPLASLIKKCIVLDLDNTLWGGVIGEDGVSGIKLGPTPSGRSFWEFQKYLLALYHRGVILAINSKNNPDDVKQVFNKHPHMVLKEHQFAATYINWNDKASNMKALAKELEIGLDSLVFIDDDPVNRELVRQEFPEVTVIEMPADPSQYVPTLLQLTDFNTFQLTDEDLKKGEMYAQQRQRNARAAAITNLDDILKELNMVVTLEMANEFTIPRIAQLTQKTNQFNMTTRRYQVEQIEEFARDPHYIVVGVGVEDKFGDNGLTGVAIIKKNTDEWLIDTFLLSCRVIGRKVEEILLAYIIDQAKQAGAKRVIGEFITTNKNAPAKDVYQRCKMSLEKEEGELQKWVFPTSKKFTAPQFITFVDQT
jgi:FkbH-like protein